MGAMKKFSILILAAGLLAGCSKTENSDPKAEGKINIDLNETKEKAQAALKDAEKNLKKGAEEVKGKLQDAGDTLKEKVEEAKDKLDAKTSEKKAGITVEVKKD